MRKSFLEEISEFSEEKADNCLVNATMTLMAEKLEIKRGEGREGWWEDDPDVDELLWDLASEHMDACKNDPSQLIDVINLLAMILFRINLGKVND